MTCHQYTCSIVVGSAWESRPLNSLYSIAWHLGKLLISVRKFQLAICRRKCHGTLDGFLEYLRVIFKSKLLTLSCEWNINVNKTSLNNSFLLRRKMRWKSSEYKSKRMKQAPQERLDLNLFSLDLFLSRCVKKNSTAFETFYDYTGCFRRNLPYFGRMFTLHRCNQQSQIRSCGNNDEISFKE